MLGAEPVKILRGRAKGGSLENLLAHNLWELVLEVFDLIASWYR